jgi:DNA helicase-2/ATP-dependent DNA helicase PcrA
MRIITQVGLPHGGLDDLIRLALDVLEDTDYLERLRYRFPFILEDEAQDSKLQRPSGFISVEGNWVRVGDPNQAIFETFTTASPQFLRDFIRDHFHVDMPESGRSQPAILEIANHLIDWVTSAHPEIQAREALQPPFITPTPAGDPQPNPPEDRSAIQLIAEKLTAEQELTWIVDSLTNWLPVHTDSTVAVLAPRNLRGFDLIKILKERKIEFVEMLNSTMETRAAAGALGNLLKYLLNRITPRNWQSLPGVAEGCIRRNAQRSVADAA